VQPALALLEFSSIAAGIDAGDAMVKRAQLRAIYAGVIQPGRYLVLVGGEVADVQESVDAGRALAGPALLDQMFLPDVHPSVVAALSGERRGSGRAALGVIETKSISGMIEAADAGAKAAEVDLLELNFEGLGGKGYLLFGGEVADVEAAVDAGVARVTTGDRLVSSVVIPQVHEELRANLEAHPRFEQRINRQEP
jgi:microcompartment protein CcmL/EutN